jgi:acyl dehydratase
VLEKSDEMNKVTLDCQAINQNGKVVAKGTAEVMAPTEKLVLSKPELPKITIA